MHGSNWVKTGLLGKSQPELLRDVQGAAQTFYAYIILLHFSCVWCRQSLFHTTWRENGSLDSFSSKSYLITGIQSHQGTTTVLIVNKFPCQFQFIRMLYAYCFGVYYR